jgi:peptidoglycan/LPS O-acetylase OafA/YrhL
MSHPADDRASHEAFLARKYFPELDGLRALSVLLVISYHMAGFVGLLWHWLAGRLGVLIFFVLSGFLITTLGLREEAERGRVSLAAFYVRRTFRIFPLYYLTLALYGFLLVGLAFPADMRPLLDFWPYLPYLAGYLQEVALLCRPVGACVPPFSHSWTLGVEEKFYLVWPLLLFVLWRRSDPTRRLAWTLGLTAALVPIALVLALLGRDWGSVGDCLFPHYHILLGCMLAQALHDPAWFERLRRLATRGRAVLILALFLAVHFAVPFAGGVPHLPRLLDMVYSALAAAFIVGLLLRDGWLPRLLRCGPLSWLGKLSYGMYLIHMISMAVAYQLLPGARARFDLNLLAYVLTCALAAGGAWLLAVLVERKAIDAGRRLSRRLLKRADRSRPALAPLRA